MQILVAEHAGFCYGVKRAFDMTLNFKKENPDKKVYTYGELIHNPEVLSKLKKKGVYDIENLDDTESNLLVIRAHGVEPEIIENAKKKGYEVRDATCPYVKKIHNITKKAYNKGDFIIIIGDCKHPEIIGIAGNCKDRHKVLANLEDADKFVKEYNFKQDNYRITLVVQTTFNKNKYQKISNVFRKGVKNLTEYNTICSSTGDRQEEIRKMAEICDYMIVLGGKNSSNTKKLYEILKDLGKKAVHIEKKSEIRFELFENCDKIGIVAGASTSRESINEIVEFLTNK